MSDAELGAAEGHAVVADAGEAPVVEVRGVTRRYAMGGNGIDAIKDAWLSVAAGEFVAVVGPSGSGKSTLLNLLGALDRPTTGEVLFGGRAVAEMSDTELARLRNAEVGFVFQQFQLLSRTTALANVGLPLVYRGLGRGERNRRAREALESVGLAERLDHRPAQLSGGEQQRVAIARALVTKPRLLLADEPTGNLDTATGSDVIELLSRLNADRRVALVVITHDPDVATRAPRRIRIRDGVLSEGIDP